MKQFIEIMYGGDYNPDQWPEEVWHEDIRLFKLANINIVTLPVFSWAKLQPSEDVYDFTWLDKTMDLMAVNNIKVCFATSTAAQPAWMSKRYPEVLPVNKNGLKRKHGGRVNFCPNSKIYRHFAAKLVTNLANRYKEHPSLQVWHIGNEYTNYCCCDNCAKEFRNWVKTRYGTIAEVNKRWNLSFWGHTIYDWDEIEPASYLTEISRDDWSGYDRDVVSFQSIVLDYMRFMSDSTLDCYKIEYDIIRQITPKIPITTNLMGFYKPLDYQKWSKYMDIISFDNYPMPNEDFSSIAMKHTLMRSLKNGQPFMLMEQTPNQVNWQPVNKLKKPGIMRLLSYQALAHGSDTVMFFQLRRSIGACEKYHSAVIDHVGHENTRVFTECSQLGKELKTIGNKTIGSKMISKIAILFDWDNWWALELSSGLTVYLDYIKEISKYYQAIHKLNISVDIISCEDQFANYEIIIAPVLYMVKSGIEQKLEKFVADGGIFVTTFFSGIVDENDMVKTGGYPGVLRKLLGIWVEETDALLPDEKNTIMMAPDIADFKSTYSCNLMCDLLHSEGAKVLATYGSDFYEKMPVITVNQFGKGKSYYIASSPEEIFLNDFMKFLFKETNIKPPFNEYTDISGLEITIRYKDDKTYTFLLNHSDEKISVNLDNKKYINLFSNKECSNLISIAAKDVIILES